jgi:hypothetical protein
VVEYLPSKCKDLNSKPNMTKTKKLKSKRTGGMAQGAEQARSQWLIPIILATQEADSRRIVVQSHLGK